MKYAFIAVFALTLSACVSTPKNLAGLSEGQWKAKALIKDNEQARSYIVNLNFNAVRGQRARMDVISTLGTGVATLLVDDKEVRYVLFDSKKFYYGQPQADVMRPILAIPFDPRWLHNILFDEALPNKSWTCSKDRNGSLQSCQDSVTGLKITWSNRNGDRKTIFIEHTKASLQINIQFFRPKVEDRKNLFVLEAPAGYQVLRVR
jgi:hypothetical protein